ncbi:MAG TPA: divalent metal cation transporter, partial [Terriglobales bacterium]|nr:divalent metal cation transporter [Terriglobales bacterium]
GYLYMVTAMIGATIAPWMQFYLQASVVEKGVTTRTYKLAKIDVIVGAIFAPIVAGFIVIACAAALNAAGHTEIHDAADAAYALRPLAGKYASILFAFGLFNASLFAASILPLSTAYTVCEGLGLESGIDKKFSEARGFYWLYTALIAAGAGVILWPEFPLLRITVLSQVVNGVLLPFVLFFMIKLVNKKDLMGNHVNSRLYNVVAWVTAGGTALLTLILVWMS